MLGGNNETPLPQDSQFQYQTNSSLNQLHLLGTMRAGCTIDPINYFANDNLATMSRNNSKRARETETNHSIQRQQKLQSSLNYNYNNNSVAQDEAPKQNLVSTGLRLSYDNDERNSCANGSITTPMFQSLGDSIRLDLDRQKEDLDQFLKFQGNQLAKGVRDIKQRHVTSFVTALEKDVRKKLQEKDQEIENMNKKNRELVEKIKQVAVESQNWHYRAKYNESVVNALKVNLQQVMSHGNNTNPCGVFAVEEGYGDSEIDDKAASYNYMNIPGMPNTGMRCKSCNVKEVSVLLVPCRHLSLCKDCDVFTGFCPVCQSFKTSSVQLPRGDIITRLRVFDSNARENLNAKRTRINFSVGPVFCKTYEEEEIPKAKLIWRAIKLPIYSVALVPLTVGASAAYLETGLVLVRRYATLMLSSVLIITWLNLSNDVYDFDTGADKNKRESVVNMVGSRAGTFAAAITTLVLGVSGLIWISWTASNIRAILLLASAILCGYIYQCPPFRLSYQGLGEPLCFAAFGPFATTAFYLLLGGGSSEMRHLPLSSRILSSSLLVGFTTSLILFCSHFHQVEGDLAVGKFSPLVRLGTEKGAFVVRWAIRLLYLMLLVLGLTKILPVTCTLLCFLTLPVGNLVSSYVENHHKEDEKIFMAKYYCVRLHALFGAALSLGLVIAR
ncbi:unnamed protein product [Brassica rapa subsp. narinosa]